MAKPIFTDSAVNAQTDSTAAGDRLSGGKQNLDIHLLEEIAAYFREVRKKYVKFEGSLRGVDSRILVAQVPGGMLTNMEGQLKEQNAEDKFDAVLAEIPKVREELGFIPLVTPTSQIVGTQAVLNVLAGERYKAMSKETRGILQIRIGIGNHIIPGGAGNHAVAADGRIPPGQHRRCGIIRIAQFGITYDSDFIIK